MAARKLTPAQQRDRRAKIMLAVLGVVLLAVVGFEVPSFLGGSGTSATSPPATTGASAVLAGAPAPAAPQQLADFSRFTAKNPFHALAGTTASPTQTAPAKAARPAAQTPTTTAAGRLPTPAPLVLTLHPVTTTTSESSKPEGPLVTAAVLRLNGVRHVITVGASFPEKHPAFKLLAVGSSTMWVRLLAGSLTNGSQTLVVHADRPVQLLNRTADLRYLLRFVRVTVAPPPAPTTTALTATVAQASP